MSDTIHAWRLSFLLALTLASMVGLPAARATEPDPSTYWKVDDLRAGMKGTGRTVMVGTRLEEFGAEVLGVMKDVSPGRDMVLCRLTGCNLEHAGIIQGMSGSPIYIGGKLLGAVAFAWEFAKDPIAGVTPFEQMLAYVRSSDRKLAAEARSGEKHAAASSGWRSGSVLIEGRAGDWSTGAGLGPFPVNGGGLAGMRPIATPLAATGFTPRALAFLEERFRPIGMAPTAGGSTTRSILEAEGSKPLVPGSPLSIAMVTGDFDLSGIGTVTHVEGDRVYGFGHPMLGLGSCEFPLMTGYIHTVYPRASVSMKMGSPLKVVGVIDADVSTGVAGRTGPKPDMLPISVRVKAGRYSDPRDFHVQTVREPNLLPSLVMAVLTNAIDTEGNLPEEVTAHLKATVRLKGHPPIELTETLSGPRFTGAMGPAALFGPIGSVVGILARNPFEKVRIESIDCDVSIGPGRSLASIESVRLSSNRLQPGQRLSAVVTLEPYKGDRQYRTIELDLPSDLPTGSYEVALEDATSSLRRRLRNEPGLTEPRDLDGLLRVLRIQTVPRRTSVYLHLALPDRGLAVRGQALPSLPGSAQVVFATNRQTQDPPVRSDLVSSVDTPWVIEGSQSLRIQVVKDTGLTLEPTATARGDRN